jgi:hypothetical protein
MRKAEAAPAPVQRGLPVRALRRRSAKGAACSTQLPLAVSVLVFLESTFIDQNNPKRQTAGPLWGSPKLDLSGLVYGGLPGVGPWPDSRF